MALPRVVIFSFRQFQFHVRNKSDYKPNSKLKMYVMYRFCNRGFMLIIVAGFNILNLSNKQILNLSSCMENVLVKTQTLLRSKFIYEKGKLIFFDNHSLRHRLITSVSLFKLSIQDVLLDKDIIITHLISSDISVFVIKLEQTFNQSKAPMGNEH